MAASNSSKLSSSYTIMIFHCSSAEASLALRVVVKSVRDFQVQIFLLNRLHPGSKSKKSFKTAKSHS